MGPGDLKQLIAHASAWQTAAAGWHRQAFHVSHSKLPVLMQKMRVLAICGLSAHCLGSRQLRRLHIWQAGRMCLHRSQSGNWIIQIWLNIHIRHVSAQVTKPESDHLEMSGDSEKVCPCTGHQAGIRPSENRWRLGGGQGEAAHGGPPDGQANQCPALADATRAPAAAQDQ